MAIPDNIIDQIQEKTDIVETVSRYIPLKKVGRNYKTTCPFHNEKTPSFIVSPDKQIYHCFGCGAGGNVFSFVMKYENMQFPEVVEMLAQRAGVVLPRVPGRRGDDTFANQLYKVNEAAASFSQNSLLNNRAAKEYLASRGVGDELINKFKIGFANDSWDSLLNYFKTKGVGGAILEKAGLVIANDKGGHYDRFRGRVIFPIVDLKDRVLGFGARVMDASLPKYINSPETPIYSKGRNLYGLNVSKEAIKKEGYALVVEGYLDFLVPYQAGIKNIIATLGTALTSDQAKLLKRFANTVIMVYDPDEAGEAASLRNLDMFISEDMNVYIAELPQGFDPDSAIRKFGADEFLKIVKSSKNLFDYKLDKLNARFDMKKPHGKAAIANEMLPTIYRINNAVMKSELVKKLAERLSVDEESLKAELKKVKPDYSQRRYATAPAEAKKDFKTAEMMLLALLLDGQNYRETIMQAVSPEEFKDSSVRDAVSAVYAMHKEGMQVNAAKLINHLGNGVDASALVSEAVNLLDMMQEKDKALEDCVARMKKDNVKERLSGLQDAIRIAHGKKDEDEVKRLVTEYNSLVKAG
ncbi:MAG: DNA primase, partial [Candidatus Omnitrophica bacterium]|nr:DNA primase [Candidatus Omnitrophota bacterium]